MHVLTVCERGLNRSTTAQWLLQHEPDTEVISAGLHTLSDDTLSMLYAWADRIVLLDGRYVQDIPADKLVLWNVGPDIYPHHFNPELVQLLRDRLKTVGTRLE